MPLYLELIVLLLATYAAGLGIGTLLWNRSTASEGDMPE